VADLTAPSCAPSCFDGLTPSNAEGVISSATITHAVVTEPHGATRPATARAHVLPASIAVQHYVRNLGLIRGGGGEGGRAEKGGGGRGGKTESQGGRKKKKKTRRGGQGGGEVEGVVATRVTCFLTLLSFSRPHLSRPYPQVSLSVSLGFSCVLLLSLKGAFEPQRPPKGGVVLCVRLC